MDGFLVLGRVFVATPRSVLPSLSSSSKSGILMQRAFILCESVVRFMPYKLGSLAAIEKGLAHANSRTERDNCAYSSLAGQDNLLQPLNVR